MASYRVTKYDPRHRDSRGRYLAEDWTSYSDVGRAIGGQVVTEEVYLTSENAYIAAIYAFMASAGITSLVVADLEARDSDVGIYDGLVLTGDSIGDVARACLREVVWCRLAGDNGFFVHFGYDYYMYIGGDVDFQTPALAPGLFVEECPSPWFADED